MKDKKNEKIMAERLTFSKTSIFIFAAAIGLILAGYLLMSRGDITVSPLLLVIGYVILIPLAILKK